MLFFFNLVIVFEYGSIFANIQIYFHRSSIASERNYQEYNSKLKLHIKHVKPHIISRTKLNYIFNYKFNAFMLFLKMYLFQLKVPSPKICKYIYSV